MTKRPYKSAITGKANILVRDVEYPIYLTEDDKLELVTLIRDWTNKDISRETKKQIVRESANLFTKILWQGLHEYDANDKPVNKLEEYKDVTKKQVQLEVSTYYLDFFSQILETSGIMPPALSKELKNKVEKAEKN